MAFKACSCMALTTAVARVVIDPGGDLTAGWSSTYYRESAWAVYNDDTYDYMMPRYEWSTWIGYTYSIIRRAGAAFDTSDIPVGANINSVHLVGIKRYSHEAIGYPSSLDEITRIVRAADLTFPGVSANLPYLRGCHVDLGHISVPAGTGHTAFDVALNAAGLASIVCGGTTKLGFRTIYDKLGYGDGHPPNETAAGNQIYSRYETTYLELQINYDEEPGCTVETLDPADLTKISVTLNGQITAGQATKRGFDWGEGEAYDQGWYESGTFGIGTFSHEVTGLTLGTEYCYKAKACCA